MSEDASRARIRSSDFVDVEFRMGRSLMGGISRFGCCNDVVVLK
jgi:hypothetical protein